MYISGPIWKAFPFMNLEGWFQNRSFKHENILDCTRENQILCYTKTYSPRYFQKPLTCINVKKNVSTGIKINTRQSLLL